MFYNVITIAACSFICGGIIGNIVGHKIHTKQIDTKILYMHAVADEIKLRNNKMVENLSKVYQMSSQYASSSFTDVDEMLLDMWID